MLMRSRLCVCLYVYHTYVAGTGSPSDALDLVLVTGQSENKNIHNIRHGHLRVCHVLNIWSLFRLASYLLILVNSALLGLPAPQKKQTWHCHISALWLCYNLVMF